MRTFNVQCIYTYILAYWAPTTYSVHQRICSEIYRAMRIRELYVKLFICTWKSEYLVLSGMKLPWRTLRKVPSLIV